MTVRRMIDPRMSNSDGCAVTNSAPINSAPIQSESELLARIMLAHSRGDARLFRLNAGLAWAGRIIERTQRKLVLLDYHPVKLGPAGVADIVGWSAGGVFTAIECKVGRRQLTPEQAAFLTLVRSAGGRAGVARTVEDAAAILTVEPLRGQTSSEPGPGSGPSPGGSR